MPRTLIDTTSRLYDKKQQAESFESLPVYSEPVSSITTEIDYARIWREVKEFYRYVMLSHRWEDGGLLLQEVENISIYKLEASLVNTRNSAHSCILLATGGPGSTSVVSINSTMWYCRSHWSQCSRDTAGHHRQFPTPAASRRIRRCPVLSGTTSRTPGSLTRSFSSTLRTGSHTYTLI